MTLTLNTMSRDDRRIWARSVKRQMDLRDNIYGGTVLVFAGANYPRHLMMALLDRFRESALRRLQKFYQVRRFVFAPCRYTIVAETC